MNQKKRQKNLRHIAACRAGGVTGLLMAGRLLIGVMPVIPNCHSHATDGPRSGRKPRTMQLHVLHWILGLMTILTVVSADVDQGRAHDLTAEFESLLARGLPEGLLETRLIGDGQGNWAIHSLWRDRAALDAMRASPEPPAAPALFRRFGAEPILVVMQVLVDSSDRA